MAELNLHRPSATVPTAQLLRSLGQVVRGLSTLFWALPVALAIYAATARMDWLAMLRGWAFVPATVSSIVVWHALRQLRDFQRQERIWQQSLDCAELLAILDIGLAPFLHWWHRFPAVPLYRVCVGLLLIFSFLLLTQINYVLQRLSAMLPDEMLRMESKLFTVSNIFMLVAAVIVWGLDYAAWQWRLPASLAEPLRNLDSPAGRWLMLFFALVPLAMTLALIWKTKEVIFTSVFNAER